MEDGHPRKKHFPQKYVMLEKTRAKMLQPRVLITLHSQNRTEVKVKLLCEHQYKNQLSFTLKTAHNSPTFANQNIK